MASLLASIFAAVLAASPASEASTVGATGRDPVLLVPGRYDARVEVRDRERMWALCDGQLRSLVVRVRPAAGTRSAGAVEVSAPCDATLLVRGIAGLRNERIVPARIIQVEPGSRRSPFGPAAVQLSFERQVVSLHRIRVGSTGYRLELRGAATAASTAPTVLYDAQSTDDAQWSLLWAGDLDRDGHVDLLVQASDAFDRREIRLFLSRPARSAGGAEAVEEVAVTTPRPVAGQSSTAK